MKTLATIKFLNTKADSPILDVRSPSEYEKGHIPSAISFPLFSDHERAEVGTLYKQFGKELAFEKGIEFVGPKMLHFVQEAKKLSVANTVKLHCWRGGQRSASMAWLLRSAGLNVEVLEGGYKSYRRTVQASFVEHKNLIVLGGPTGSGKTKILHGLKELGEQVIDLEGLANHKGSAFGSLGERPQPSVEYFENLLFTAFKELDNTRPIWVENESRKVGKAVIPDALWFLMRKAPLISMKISEHERIENLINDYAKFPKKDLISSFENIKKRLGGQHLKTAIEAIEKEDFASAAKVALVYYDKTYSYGLENTQAVTLEKVPMGHLSFQDRLLECQKIAAKILN